MSPGWWAWVPQNYVYILLKVRDVFRVQIFCAEQWWCTIKRLAELIWERHCKLQVCIDWLISVPTSWKVHIFHDRKWSLFYFDFHVRWTEQVTCCSKCAATTVSWEVKKSVILPKAMFLIHEWIKTLEMDFIINICHVLEEGESKMRPDLDI